MQNFTPYSALIGGTLIGLAAAMLMFFNGRIAGISGIVSGILFPKNQNWLWRVAFVMGLILAPILIQRFGFSYSPAQIKQPMALVLISGLLVGYGTSLANGCTSGHGVCGLARLSLRSALATLTFMGCAGLTVYLLRHQFNLGL